ncbi:MAG: hypothetical protein AABX33_07290 [Nanoarchaeota archaeon]
MNANYANAIAIVLVVVLVTNVTLLALNKIHELLFWVIIMASALFAYKIVPKLEKKLYL